MWQWPYVVNSQEGALNADNRADHSPVVGDRSVQSFSLAELGKGEDLLDGLSEVRGCAVIVRNEGQLVAPLVCDGPFPDTDEIRATLFETLPQHLVPALVMRLDALSMNSEGNAGTVPIGRPLTNSHVVLVDQDRNLIPHGVPGKLLSKFFDTGNLAAFSSRFEIFLGEQEDSEEIQACLAEITDLTLDEADEILDDENSDNAVEDDE